jgi:hypothetical protein
MTTPIVHLHLDVHLEDLAADRLAELLRSISDALTPTAPPLAPPAPPVPEPAEPAPPPDDDEPPSLTCSCGKTFLHRQGLASCRRSHETVQCECGRTLSRTGLGPHRRSCPGPPPPEPAAAFYPFEKQEPAPARHQPDAKPTTTKSAPSGIPFERRPFNPDQARAAAAGASFTAEE